MDVEPILEKLVEGCCPGCMEDAMAELDMQLRPLDDLTATSKIKENLLQTEIVPILIAAVGTPDHSQQFYHSAIANLCHLGGISDERLVPQIMENRGCETVLARLKNATTDPFVSHGCIVFLFRFQDHVPEETRSNMAHDILNAVNITFGRNVEASFKQSHISFEMCCYLIRMAFHGVHQSRDDLVDVARAVQFGLQGYMFFHGEEDRRAQSSAKMLVEALVGKDHAKELIDHCNVRCEPCAPPA